LLLLLFMMILYVLTCVTCFACCAAVTIMWIFCSWCCFYTCCMCCRLVFNSRNVSNIGLCVAMCVSFMCNMFLLNLCMCAFVMYLDAFPLLVSIISIVSYIFRTHALYLIYHLSSPSYHLYSWLPVYIYCIQYKKVGPFGLHISVGNPDISFHFILWENYKPQYKSHVTRRIQIIISERSATGFCNTTFAIKIWFTRIWIQVILVTSQFWTFCLLISCCSHGQLQTCLWLPRM
jgi:hypothetical protein